MRNHYITRISVTILLLIFILNSCSNLRIEKRQHRFGYHVHWTKNYRGPDSKTIELDKNYLIVSTKNDDTSFISASIDNEINTHSIEEQTNSQIQPHQLVPDVKKFKKEPKISRRSKDILITKKQVKQFQPELAVNRSQNHKDYSGYLYLIVLIIPFGAVISKRSYKLSRWASDNRKKAQHLLIFSKVLLAIASISLSLLLGITFSPLILLSASILIIGIVLFNHFKNEKSYLHRKTSTFGVSTGLVAIAMNSGANLFEGEFILDPALVIVLSILTLIVLAGLLYLISILSCNLACSGYELAAYALFFIGNLSAIVGASFLLAFLWKTDEPTPLSKRFLNGLMVVICFIIMAIAILYYAPYLFA